MVTIDPMPRIRKTVTITPDHEIWKAFCKWAWNNDSSATAELEKFMRETLDKAKAKEKQKK